MSPRKSSRRKRRQRRLGLALLVVVLALAGVGYFGGESVRDLLPDGLAERLPSASGDGSGDGSTGGSGDSGGGASGDVDADRAREMLAGLTVAEWDSMQGYSRERFSHWLTVDGCDVRQTVLARDGENIETESDSCRVTSGDWYSVYDGETFTDPGDLDIDHTVPLANAWRTGASAWDDDRRADFANDLDRPQLFAVSASSNRAKGDQDPSQWQPPERDYWCQYAHDWVVVKDYWELSVTEAERDTLADMLDTCG